MNKKYLNCILSALFVVLVFVSLQLFFFREEEKIIRVGYIYVGDASTAYTYNFIKAEDAIAEKFGQQVQNVAMYNVPEGNEDEAIRALVRQKCDIIFGTSYGYAEAMKHAAKEFPEIQFCQATGNNASEEPVLANYHTFMGHIYEGRYVAGVAAGMKMKEMINKGVINADEAVIGYVASFPYAEVISGYTAFLMGAKAYCPEAEMKVIYTNTWSNFMIEKNAAERLIEQGCIFISQHSDTIGPAIACENANEKHPVYHVGYNQSMVDVAPTTSLIGCRINWVPYMEAAVNAMLEEKPIEKIFDRKVKINGTDVGAGFDEGWVEMLELNQVIAAEGTEEELEKCIQQFKKGKISVFQGEYTGVDPFDPSDRYDLNTEYKENEYSSAPTFHYILQGLIHIEE